MIRPLSRHSQGWGQVDTGRFFATAGCGVAARAASYRSSMSRPLRIAVAGGLYHVTSRGNRRETIYWDDVDRCAWLHVLGKVCSRNHWRVHAWCQMANHFHLVVETPEPNLADGMRLLNGVYTQRTNARHKRCGHIFQGRYHAVLIERQTHLLELARYVVLNPVRARLVADPADWPWSSYRATSALATTPPWLATQWILSQFGAVHAEAVPRYRRFVAAAIGATPNDPLGSSPSAAGNPAFVGAALSLGCESARGTDLSEVPHASRRPLAPTLTEIQAQFSDRDKAMAHAYATGGYTMRAIGAHFGVHRTTVAKAVRALESLQADVRGDAFYLEKKRPIST